MLNSGPFMFKRYILSHYPWLDRPAHIRPVLSMGSYLIAKRIMDITLVLVGLPLILPIMILCAILIKLDDPRGPVIFTQQRTGKGGRRFTMYKVRTMVPNAEELKKQLAFTNEDGELARPLKLSHDSRITRVGRILRKTSLDELPQVLNIVKGDMSWVGPRPTSFGLKSYALWHTERLDVLPGITGLWQLYGRGDTDFDSWLFWDNLYMERQCIWLDIQIMVRTVLAVLTQRGAH
jgi:lipopolysaccharide/colanic/teichoic acid biosynthesis glycosyltransferase